MAIHAEEERDFVRRTLSRAAGELEAIVDWARYRKRGRGPFRIVPYRGHGTTKRFYLKGRVLEGSPIPSAQREDPPWRNLMNAVRRMKTDEVPAARVRARVGTVVEEALADDEGYFEISMEVEIPTVAGETWHTVHLELLDPPEPGPGGRATGYVLVPPPGASFGVISDIDDTVVRTDVTSILSMLRMVLLTNAHTRLPFEGVAAFYRALHRGDTGDRTNPIFYVSSSPWNLYDLLHEVFQVHAVPPGPLFLKDYGLKHDLLFSRRHREHKLEAIEHILTAHPDLRFLLIGDSGQKDPEIYREVVERHPGRILTIYIRDVSRHARVAEVRAIRHALAGAGVEMVLVADTVGAARHAAAHHFVDPSSLPEIRGETAKDRSAPGPLASAMTPRGRRSGSEPP
jgi:phosphatidate phosphatase APP1